MAKTRRAYTGGAASTTTTSVIAASGTTSFTITAYTGWPYGSDPFFVVVEPGTANEEKMLVTRTGSTDTTINVYATPSVAANRGADGTSSVAHSSGVTVFPVFTALDADEANELTSAFGSKGDLVSYGSSTFETLGVGTNDQVLIADSGEASGLKWGSVDTAQLADDAVTTAKIDDGAVTSAKVDATAFSLTANAETGTTYTLVAGDLSKYVTLDNAAAITLTVPDAVFSAGDQVNLVQLGAGQVTIAAGAGVTLRSEGSKLKIKGQYGVATLLFLAADEAVVLGNLEA